MAYADPQSVTVSGSAKSLPRTGTSLSAGTFTSNDREYTLKVSHQNGSRLRHMARLEQATVVASPTVPSQNENVSMSVHIVIDTPRNGVLSTAEIKAVADALVGWASASSGANIAKLIAFEN